MCIIIKNGNKIWENRKISDYSYWSNTFKNYEDRSGLLKNKGVSIMK